jgi:hypothetical protein
VKSSDFYVLDSVLKFIACVELPNEAFTSEKMLYLLKNILLFILVIFKLKHNDLSFNEIIILNTLFICLHSSFYPCNPQRYLISEIDSVTLPPPRPQA